MITTYLPIICMVLFFVGFMLPMPFGILLAIALR